VRPSSQKRLQGGEKDEKSSSKESSKEKEEVTIF
jgi:hypothetical protein